jgi:hypothetical protein
MHRPGAVRATSSRWKPSDTLLKERQRGSQFRVLAIEPGAQHRNKHRRTTLASLSPRIALAAADKAVHLPDICG